MPSQKEIFELYSGSVKLEYTDSTHRYRASINGEKFQHTPSVTTILNVLNKPALVEWGVRCACNDIEDNMRALFAGGSFTEQQILNIITRGRTAHDRVREEAAEIGTNVHDWLAGYWKSDRAVSTMPEEERTRKCINAALDWFAEHDLKPVAVEEPLYSKELNICGRPDWIGYVDGELSVLDYKSTKQIYPELALQCTAYGQIFYEMGVDKPETRWGLRLDKETGEFEARRYPPETFDLDWDSFKCCFTIYDRMKHLRRKPKKEDVLAEL